MTATRSMIKRAPKNPVWKQFIVKNAPGFSASRMNSTMARISMSRQMAVNNRNTTKILQIISMACLNMNAIPSDLRNGWLCKFPNAINCAERVCIYSYKEQHDKDAHNPERNEHALLPLSRLTRHCGRGEVSRWSDGSTNRFATVTLSKGALDLTFRLRCRGFPDHCARVRRPRLAVDVGKTRIGAGRRTSSFPKLAVSEAHSSLIMIRACIMVLTMQGNKKKGVLRN